MTNGLCGLPLRVAAAGISTALLTAVVAGLAFAQSDVGKPDGADKPAAEAQRKHPRPSGKDNSRNLEFLLGALKAAPDEASAKAVENRILALWLASGSDTADLLMSRVKAAVDGKDVDLAIRLLDALVEINPDYVEAWNRRATLYFTQKKYGQALADIRQVLAREPRHFGALVGLGLIMQELGEDQRALEVLRRAIDVHPHLPRVPEMIKELSSKVDGRDI